MQPHNQVDATVAKTATRETRKPKQNEIQCAKSRLECICD